MTTDVDELMQLRLLDDFLDGEDVEPELADLQAEIAQAQLAVKKANLRAIQDEAVAGVLAAQAAHGIPILTDGEFRRRNFVDSVATSVSGIFGEWIEVSGINQSGTAGGSGTLSRSSSSGSMNQRAYLRVDEAR